MASKKKKKTTGGKKTSKPASKKPEVTLEIRQYEVPDNTEEIKEANTEQDRGAPVKNDTDLKKDEEKKSTLRSRRQGVFAGRKNRFLKKDKEEVIPDADQVNQSLAAIYEGQPSKEWLKTIEHKRQKTWVIVLTSFMTLIFLTSIAAWIGFWWWGMQGFNGEGVEIQIEGPDQVSVGQEVTYFVNWFNVAREPLATTEFRISFPNDFLVTNIDPRPTSEPMVFRLGAQPIEGRGTVKVTGVFTGALGTSSAIQVITNYRPASFNSDFEELDTKEIQYTQSVITGELELPSKVIPGDDIEIKYRIKNTGSRTMEHLRARFELPNGFVPSASTTQEMLDAKEYFVEIDSIDAGDEQTIILPGAFAVRSGGDIPIIAETGFVLGDGAFAAAQRSKGIISVLAGDLDVEVVINGNQDDRNVNLGDWQRLAIAYENMSGETLEDIELVLHIENQDGSPSNIIDWDEWQDELSGDFDDESTITYTDDQIEDLQEMAPNTDGFIEVSVPLKEEIASEDDMPLQIYVEAKIGLVAGDRVNRTVKTKSIMLALQSDARISSIARFTSEEGAPVGSGPLPPVVGSSTVYRIEWKINKSLHELDRLTVSANLPPAVAFQAQKEIDAGVLDYDSSKKLVTWTINHMPEDVDQLILSFDVALRPSEADLGRFAQLLGETRFEFTDTKLDAQILRTAESITTDLPDDPLAKQKGVVSR